MLISIYVYLLLSLFLCYAKSNCIKRIQTQFMVIDI